ncbi:hypothetical protein ACLOJK_027038 [Asimina triloba]
MPLAISSIVQLRESGAHQGDHVGVVSATVRVATTDFPFLLEERWQVEKVDLSGAEECKSKDSIACRSSVVRKASLGGPCWSSYSTTYGIESWGDVKGTSAPKEVICKVAETIKCSIEM